MNIMGKLLTLQFIFLTKNNEHLQHNYLSFDYEQTSNEIMHLKFNNYPEPIDSTQTHLNVRNRKKKKKTNIGQIHADETPPFPRTPHQQ